MIDQRLQELLEEGIDVNWFADAGRDSLCRHLANLKAHRCRVDAVEANVLVAINRFDKRQAPSARPSDTADDVTEQTGESGAEANRKARRAGLFDHYPEVSAALAAGEITAGHADLLATVPSRYHQRLEADLAALLATAAGQSVDEFKQSLRVWRDQAAAAAGEDPHQQRRDRRNCHLSDTSDGMLRLNGLFDPEAGAIIANAMNSTAQRLLRDEQQDASTNRRTHPQRLADALTQICRHHRADRVDNTHAGNDSGVIITIGLAELLAGGDGQIVGGGQVSAEAVRKHACENGIIPLVLGADSAILDMGRRTRFATTAQRLALATRHNNTCAVPTCGRPFQWCHIHHIRPWSHDGLTDIDNLIPLCTRHHTQIHEGQLHHSRTDGQDHWHRPNRRKPAHPDLRETLQDSYRQARGRSRPGQSQPGQTVMRV